MFSRFTNNASKSALSNTAGKIGLKGESTMNLAFAKMTSSVSGSIKSAAGAVKNYTAGSHIGRGINVGKKAGVGMGLAAMGRGISQSPVAQAGYGGAAAGAAWGMASNDTSVLGGMAIGAGAGIGAIKGYGALSKHMAASSLRSGMGISGLSGRQQAAGIAGRGIQRAKDSRTGQMSMDI